MLLELGCDLIQDYFLYKALPSERLVTYLLLNTFDIKQQNSLSSKSVILSLFIILLTI